LYHQARKPKKTGCTPLSGSQNFKVVEPLKIDHKNIQISEKKSINILCFIALKGQGVVLERSCFSDSVIGQSLYENNLLSDEAYKFYMRDLVPNTVHELWKPHVSIYLDKSPEDCLKTIREKGKVSHTFFLFVKLQDSFLWFSLIFKYFCKAIRAAK
jgi:hypothetical protein